MIQKYTMFLVVAVALALSASAALAPAEAQAQQCECGSPLADGPDNKSAEPGARIADPLPADEVASLQWMREEEKLARDVYLALYDVWLVKVFKNISRAEAAHMRAVKSLLNFYGVDDPAAGNSRGEFTEPAIQDLYDSLVAKGGKSLIDALEVGAYIEELDILDLRERASDYTDIQRVYTNLERGSENHLRAFVKNLARRGVDYDPRLMTQEQFEAIVGTSAEAGAWARGRSGGNDPTPPRRGRGGRSR